MPPASAPPSDGRRVFITGMFDMANYGDLMFPLIAQQRLAAAGVEVVAVAPRGGPPPVPGALPSLGLAEMFETDGRVDAVLIGGGYIVHTFPLTFIEDYEAGAVTDWGGAGLWLGATLAVALHDVPVVWNAPGVPFPLRRSQADAVAAALRAADYVSLRDRGAADLIGAPDDVEVTIVPDTVADLPRLWPRRSLEADFAGLIARKGGTAEDRHVAIHLRRRSVAGVPLARIAAEIDRFAATTGLVPLLVAVGESHDDPALARAISPLITARHVLLDDPRDLREITAALAFAALYVGASLHGYIASAAYGVPGVLVARPSYRKFGGFLEHTGRAADLARDWPGAFARAVARLDEGSVAFPVGLSERLDAHWQRIAAIITGGGGKTNARRALLEEARLRAGAGADGAALVRALAAATPSDGTDDTGASARPGETMRA
ncbi:polysaccharide pyruvyl transferase family protein [Pseudoxanthobacter sp. M-2]|uniref:polysaccharide pyruvyl transferase family protein n=1 Tax=Pseudoxanthobacter sp. M-2 TaxID=3078754 RepID=UPI0038FC65DA